MWSSAENWSKWKFTWKKEDKIYSSHTVLHHLIVNLFKSNLILTILLVFDCKYPIIKGDINLSDILIIYPT